MGAMCRLREHCKQIVGARRRRLLAAMLVSACTLGCLGVAVDVAASAGPAAAQATAATFNPVPGTPFSVVTNQSLNAVAYSPSGELLATANDGGNVSVFSIAPDGSLSQAPGSPYAISEAATALEFSSSGVLAVTAGEDIYTYTVAANGSLTPTPDSPFVNPSADYTSLAFSRNGQTLATGEGGGPFFDTFSVSANGTLTPDNNGNVNYVPRLTSSVAFSPSGLLAVGYYGGVSLYTVASDGSVTQAPGSPYAIGGQAPTSVAFGPGGQLAVANAGNSTVSTFTVAANGSLTPAPGSPYATGSGPDSVAFDATGDLAVTNGNDSTVSVFSIAADGSLTQQSGSPYATGPNPDSAAFSPNDLLAVGDRSGGGVGGEVSEFASSATDVEFQFPSSDPIIEADGQTFTETMAVQNNGTSATTSPSVMQLNVPTNPYVRITNYNGGQHSGNTVTWPVPVLQPGQTVTETITLKAVNTAPQGTVQLTGSTPAPLNDANPSNNTAVLPITVGPGA